MKKENQQIKYFVYARRSIEKKDKEIKVASIESQLREVQEMAARNDLKIVGTFSEAKSAKRLFIRTEFNRMMAAITKGEADGILVWKIDRLARNLTDGGAIIQLLQDGVVKDIRSMDKSWTKETNIVEMAVEFGVAGQYSKDLAKHILRGLRDRLKEGVRPSIAPLGYLNSKYHEKGNEEILVDDDRFMKVRKVWELMLTGQYAPLQLVDIADKQLQLTIRDTPKYKNRAMGKSNMYRLLTNPFYYGEFEFPEGSGDWYKGKHKAMISKFEFDKVQFLLGREGKPRPKTHIFAYTGLMRCNDCGGRITAEEKWKRPKNGNVHHYVYYRCTGNVSPNCTEKSVEVKVLEKQIDDFLTKIEIPQEFHEWAVEELKKLHESEKTDRNTLLFTHQKEYDDCVARLDNLADKLLDGSMSGEMYKRKEPELLRQKASLKRLLDGDDKRIDDWLVRLESTLTFAQRAREEFAKGDIAKRRQILTALGTEHILKDRQVYIETEKPLLVLQEVVSENNRIQGSVEPPNDVANKQHLKEMYAKSSLMWRWAESNRRAKRNAYTTLQGVGHSILLRHWTSRMRNIVRRRTLFL